jgi:hypothetical protein
VPEGPGVAPDGPLQPRELEFPNPKLDQILSKLHEILHRLSGPYSKAFPERSTQNDHGISRNFRSREKAIFGQERGKLKIYLLMGNQQVRDVLRHISHILASPKEPKVVEKLVGKAKHQKPLRFHPKNNLERGNMLHTRTRNLLLHLDVFKWKNSSYKDPYSLPPFILPLDAKD